MRLMAFFLSKTPFSKNLSSVKYQKFITLDCGIKIEHFTLNVNRKIQWVFYGWVIMLGMLKKPKTEDSHKETIGQRISRLRREKGFAQAELAQKAGTIQRIISDYERNRLRPHPEMIIRLSMALGVSTDELLGLKAVKKDGPKPSLRISQRLKKIAELPPSQQKALLKTIDTFLKGAEK